MSLSFSIPAPASGVLEGPRAYDAPQVGPVTWALTRASSHRGVKHEPPAARLALMCMAHHADCALWSGDGYSGTSAATLAVLMGVSTSTASKYLRLLAQCGLVLPHWSMPGLFRIPEEALNGSWRSR